VKTSHKQSEKTKVWKEFERKCMGFLENRYSNFDWQHVGTGGVRRGYGDGKVDGVATLDIDPFVLRAGAEFKYRTRKISSNDVLPSVTKAHLEDYFCFLVIGSSPFGNECHELLQKFKLRHYPRLSWFQFPENKGDKLSSFSVVSSVNYDVDTEISFHGIPPVRPAPTVSIGEPFLISFHIVNLLGEKVILDFDNSPDLPVKLHFEKREFQIEPLMSLDLSVTAECKAHGSFKSLGLPVNVSGERAMIPLPSVNSSSRIVPSLTGDIALEIAHTFKFEFEKKGFISVPRVLFLKGSAGTGKTRIADILAREANAYGFRVVRQIMMGDSERNEITQTWRALNRILWGAAEDGYSKCIDSGPDKLADMFFENIRDSDMPCPAFWLIEDLHKSSVFMKRLIMNLMTRIVRGRQPVFFCLSYRPENVYVDETLYSLVKVARDLKTEYPTVVTFCDLKPLSHKEAFSLVNQMFVEPMRDPVVEDLLAKCGTVPYNILQTVLHLRDGAKAIGQEKNLLYIKPGADLSRCIQTVPDSIKDVLKERVDILDRKTKARNILALMRILPRGAPTNLFQNFLGEDAAQDGINILHSLNLVRLQGSFNHLIDYDHDYLWETCFFDTVKYSDYYKRLSENSLKEVLGASLSPSLSNYALSLLSIRRRDELGKLSTAVELALDNDKEPVSHSDIVNLNRLLIGHKHNLVLQGDSGFKVLKNISDAEVFSGNWERAVKTLKRIRENPDEYNITQDRVAEIDLSFCTIWQGQGDFPQIDDEIERITSDGYLNRLSPSMKANILNRSSVILLQRGDMKAISLAEKAMSIVDKDISPLVRAKLSTDLAYACLLINDDIGKAVDIWQNMTDMYKKYERELSQYDRSVYERKLALMNYLREQWEPAYYHAQRSASIAKERRIEIAGLRAGIIVGSAAFRMKRIDESIEIFNRMEILARSIGVFDHLHLILSNQAVLHLSRGQTKKAKQCMAEIPEIRYKIDTVFGKIFNHVKKCVDQGRLIPKPNDYPRAYWSGSSYMIAL